jgi:hypothetical protein
MGDLCRIISNDASTLYEFGLPFPIMIKVKV